MGTDADVLYARTLNDRWRRAVEAGRDRTFLVWQGLDQRLSSWTYGEFDRVAGEVAGCLRSYGLGKGDTLHLVAANCPAYVAVLLAAARLGAIVACADPQASVPELVDHRKRLRPALAVVSAARRADYGGLVEDDAVVIGPDEDDDVEFGSIRGPWVPLSDVQPDDPLAIMFTSGTTSRPKAVVLTQANYAFAGDIMAAAAALTPDDRNLIVLPLFHANAQFYSLASAISVGASVGLVPRFSASGFLRHVAELSATCASLFASPIRMILARNREDRQVALRHVWFAQNLTADHYEQFASLVGCRPRQLYGMTETVPAVLTTNSLDAACDIIGEATIGCAVDIWLSPGVRATCGEVGELVVYGFPGRTLFAGYWDEPETAAAPFADGVFRTGDLAFRDGNGLFHFAGRRSEVLKVGGENVSTAEVETVVGAFPGVLEVAVVPTPDPILDEVPVAFIVPVDRDRGLDRDELARWCAARLAPAKRPRSFEVVDQLPRTSVGKIRKFLLRPNLSLDDR